MFQLFYNYAHFMPVINPFFLALFIATWLKRKQEKWRLIPCAATLLITLYHAEFIIGLSTAHISLMPLLNFSALHMLNLLGSAYFLIFALSSIKKNNKKMVFAGFTYTGILLLHSFTWVTLMGI